jgi:hypothetical protein
MNHPRRSGGRRGWAGLTAAVVTAVLSGCGSQTICPVEGQVVWKDGTPAKELEGSLISFDLPEKQTNATGIVQADGTFRLTTKVQDDGALAGEYTVVIIERRKTAGGPDPSALAPGLMDVKYSDASKSDLRATVKAGKNEITLTVERAKGDR